MGFLSAVTGFENEDGSNPSPLRPDGTRDPIIVVLGSGLIATAVHGRLTLAVGNLPLSAFTEPLTDELHGALGWSIDGSALEASQHHENALPGVEGHAGFLSLDWANNLQWYTGQAIPTVVGSFGAVAPTTGAAPADYAYGHGLAWVERDGIVKYTRPREALEGPGIELYDGVHVLGIDGGTVTLPDGVTSVHPFSRGTSWEAIVDATESASAITIACPSGHRIGVGLVDTNYVVAVGAMVSIRPAGPSLTTWAIQTWTV